MICATDPTALSDDGIASVNVRQLVRRTRTAQGLPPTVTDPSVLARIAELIEPTGPAPTRNSVIVAELAAKGDTR